MINTSWKMLSQQPSKWFRRGTSVSPQQSGTKSLELTPELISKDKEAIREGQFKEKKNMDKDTECRRSCLFPTCPPYPGVLFLLLCTANFWLSQGPLLIVSSVRLPLMAQNTYLFLLPPSPVTSSQVWHLGFWPHLLFYRSVLFQTVIALSMGTISQSSNTQDKVSGTQLTPQISVIFQVNIWENTEFCVSDHFALQAGG